MDREPVPSAIVARLLEAAKKLEQWAVEHRQASLAEHERGSVADSSRRHGAGARRRAGTGTRAGPAGRSAATRGVSWVRQASVATSVARAEAGERVWLDAVPTAVLLVSRV
jgi:hypothetical protein